MKKIEDPFADQLPGQDSKESVAPPPYLDVSGVIRRLAEIEDELARRGVDPLEKEKAKLRKALKDHMAECASEAEYDETSGWEAVIQQRFSDSWDVDHLKAMLTPTQRVRYIAESVSVGAVGDGVKNGDLSRGELEANGAVARMPGAKALYVRERQEKNNEL